MKRLRAIFWTVLVSTALVGGVSATSFARLSTPVAQANDTFTHKDAGVTFTLPKGWTAKPDGDTITASSSDDSVQVVLWVPDEDTFDAAVTALDKELNKTIKNMKTTGKGKSDTHNGMAHYEESGTGEVSGTTIMWSVDVLAAKKPLIILTFAAPNILDKHVNEYLQLVGSIKRVE